MVMAFSSISRCISRKAAAAAYSPYNVGRLAMSSLVSNNNNIFKYSSSNSPWLMLTPAFEHNTLFFNFYSLSQDKVLNFTSNIKSFMGDHMMMTDIKLVSSSHGWLTLFNPHNCDLFLFNPLSRRHIKLPPIHFLPIPQRNLKGGFGCVIKLITSCSPEEEDCRVMMSFGPHRRLAFCCPTSNRPEWTVIGDKFRKDNDGTLYARAYEDFVYSSGQKLFYSLTDFEEDFETWDLQDIDSYHHYKVTRLHYQVPDDDDHDKTDDLQEVCISRKYLVVAEDSGDIYWVRRHVMPHMATDGSYVDYCLDKVAADKLPYKTVGFHVQKFDPEKCQLVHMDGGSLDGLSLFIGNNHSFAIRASTGLKPNSIYFTDVNTSLPPRWETLAFVGHDIGIFNYEDQTFSSCYYPCDRQSVRTIIPAPMWFTPTN